MTGDWLFEHSLLGYPLISWSLLLVHVGIPVCFLGAVGLGACRLTIGGEYRIVDILLVLVVVLLLIFLFARIELIRLLP